MRLSFLLLTALLLAAVEAKKKNLKGNVQASPFSKLQARIRNFVSQVSDSATKFNVDNQNNNFQYFEKFDSTVTSASTSTEDGVPIYQVGVDGRNERGVSSVAYVDYDSYTFEGPAPCITDDTDLAYVNSQLSATQTFYNCLSNVADPGMVPTYFNGSYHGLLVMNSTMVLNNLERINEVEGTARLQFSLRLRWRDDRLAMPNFWEKVSAKTQSEGIDLTNLYFTNTSSVMWTPVLRFTDSSDIEFQVEFLKFNASNIFLMGIGVDCTLLQPNFNFQRYPWDTQTVAVRFNIFNMPAALAKLSFWGGDGLIFNTNYDGRATFKENPIWDFRSYSYTTYIGNNYYYWYYEINVARIGGGIVLRLVLPITLLLCLAALTFWIVYDNRVDTTITLLLSVSALYIVILGNIPLLGYLTDVDKFVFAMFFLLVLIVALHQWYVTLRQKEDQWPLRPVVMRLIELCGRVMMVPVIVVYFLAHVYKQPLSSGPTIVMTTLVLVLFTTILWRELYGLRKVGIQSFINLLQKVNKATTTVQDISFVETLVINIVVFRKYSFSRNFLAKQLNQYGAVDIEPYMAVSTKLQNLSLLRQLHTGSDAVSVENGATQNNLKRISKRNPTHDETIQQGYVFASQGFSSSSSSAAANNIANVFAKQEKQQEEFRLSVTTSGIQLRDIPKSSSDATHNPLSSNTLSYNPQNMSRASASALHSATTIDSDDE